MVPDAPFLSWCESRGIASPLQLQGIGSNYRYLSSQTDLPAGSILSVPLDACLVANTKEVLAEKLLHEKTLGSKSEYAPYLQMLPPNLSAFQDFPRFWTDERRDLLFGLDGGQVERRIATDERKELDPWACACVCSRSNFLSDYRYSITPLLDFLNHDPNVGTAATISDDGVLELSTNQNWKCTPMLRFISTRSIAALFFRKVRVYKIVVIIGGDLIAQSRLELCSFCDDLCYDRRKWAMLLRVPQLPGSSSVLLLLFVGFSASPPRFGWRRCVALDSSK